MPCVPSLTLDRASGIGGWRADKGPNGTRPLSLPCQAAALFLVFGVRMLHEGVTMSATDSSDRMAEEIREVEEELSTGPQSSTIPLEDLEGGKAFRTAGTTTSRPGSPRNGSKDEGGLTQTMQRYLSIVASPVFVQAFVLTFLGEWGDRSQIATIALAAAHVRSSLSSRLRQRCSELTIPVRLDP